MENHKASDELRFIKETIEKSRRRFADNGKDYIVWGTLTAAACVATSFAIPNLTQIGLAWLVAYALGIWFSFFSKKKQSGAINFLDKIVVNIWLASLFALAFLVVVAVFSPYISPLLIPVFPSVILALAYYSTGCIYQDNLLRLVGVSWFIAAIVLSVWVCAKSLLVLAGLLMFLQVVPGILIYKRSKNGQV